MANPEPSPSSPRLFDRLDEQEKSELLKFIKDNVRSYLSESSDLGDRFGDAVRSEHVSLAIDNLEKKTGDTGEDVLLKALTLYEVATDAVKKGQRLAILGPDYRFIREIIGLGRPGSEAEQPKILAR